MYDVHETHRAGEEPGLGDDIRTIVGDDPEDEDLDDEGDEEDEDDSDAADDADESDAPANARRPS